MKDEGRMGKMGRLDVGFELNESGSWQFGQIVVALVGRGLIIGTIVSRHGYTVAAGLVAGVYLIDLGAGKTERAMLRRNRRVIRSAEARTRSTRCRRD